MLKLIYLAKNTVTNVYIQKKSTEVWLDVQHSSMQSKKTHEQDQDQGNVTDNCLSLFLALRSPGNAESSLSAQGRSCVHYMWWISPIHCCTLQQAQGCPLLPHALHRSPYPSPSLTCPSWNHPSTRSRTDSPLWLLQAANISQEKLQESVS